MSVKCSEVVNYNISLGYYKLLKQMFDELIKYIKGYKSFTYEYYKKILDFQFKYGTKLTKPTEAFQNASWLNSLHIIKLTSKIPQIIQLQIENIKSFITGVEQTLKPLDDFFKEKSQIIKKCEKKYEEANDNLIKKYIDVEKVKINYLNSMNKTEDIVNKYYDHMYNEVDKTKIKEYENQMKNSINSSKKVENDYKNIIENSIKNEDIFINVINECIHDVKDTTTDVSEKMKEIILYFFVSIKNIFKLPLSELEFLLPHLTDVDEKKEMDKIMTETFNTGSNLIHIEPVKYSLKFLNLNDNQNDNLNNNDNNIANENVDNNSNRKSRDNSFKKKRIFQKFYDGIEEMSYFEDDASLKTAIEMNNNFELLDFGTMDLRAEDEKNIIKNYSNKIINNMSNNDNNLDLNETQIADIKLLLTKHDNRIIFLHKLNDYRTCGKLELKDKYYKLLGTLFSFIADEFKKENNDFHSIELVIILSQTYYITVFNNKKEYLQSTIEDNEIFKSKDFWEKYLEYAINKEIIRNKTIVNNVNDDTLETKKINNIIFAKSLSLIDNMVEFGLEKETIKEIIDPKIEQYKLADDLKTTIYTVIQNKIDVRENKEPGENDNDVSNYIMNELYG